MKKRGVVEENPIPDNKPETLTSSSQHSVLLEKIEDGLQSTLSFSKKDNSRDITVYATKVRYTGYGGLDNPSSTFSVDKIKEAIAVIENM